jgi:hypothetical protein
MTQPPPAKLRIDNMAVGCSSGQPGSDKCPVGAYCKPAVPPPPPPPPPDAAGGSHGWCGHSHPPLCVAFAILYRSKQGAGRGNDVPARLDQAGAAAEEDGGGAGIIAIAAVAAVVVGVVVFCIIKKKKKDAADRERLDKMSRTMQASKDAEAAASASAARANAKLKEERAKAAAASAAPPQYQAPPVYQPPPSAAPPSYQVRETPRRPRSRAHPSPASLHSHRGSAAGHLAPSGTA